jgi:hypothetical protein
MEAEKRTQGRFITHFERTGQTVSGLLLMQRPGGKHPDPLGTGIAFTPGQENNCDP